MSDAGPIVEALAEILGPAAAAPVALDGGITNRNFRVRLGERDYFLRLPGHDTELLGIDREAEGLANAAAAGLGIAPAVAAAGPGYLVTELLDAEPIDGSRLRASPQAAAEALRAFHDSGLALPTRFWVPELLGDYERIVAQRGAALPPQFGAATALARRIAAVLPLTDPVPCHNDLLPSNILAVRTDPDRPVLVDWEYAGIGHRMFDLGNLAVNNEFDEAAEERLLSAYYAGREPSSASRAALKLMRIMSDAREAAWGVVQAAISELEYDFGDYARSHFARLEQASGDSRLEQWLAAAAGWKHEDGR